MMILIIPKPLYLDKKFHFEYSTATFQLRPLSAVYLIPSYDSAVVLVLEIVCVVHGCESALARLIKRTCVVKARRQPRPCGSKMISYKAKFLLEFRMYKADDY